MPGCSGRSGEPWPAVLPAGVVADGKHSEGSRKAASERGQNTSRRGKG